MDTRFEAAYKQLNPEQRTAVDTIEGPVLVIAGPGTGKTQLLSLRIANILHKTDTLPSNILCLTFTDSAAHTMRERLTDIIGKDAYDITISTYHAFGSDLLRRYPEYFDLQQDMRPADDLSIDAIFRSVQASLPYGNPLRYDTFIRDIKQLVSDSKRALLGPEELRAIGEHNGAFIEQASKLVQEKLDGLVRIDKKAPALFAELASATKSLRPDKLPGVVVPLAELWQQDLEAALASFEETGKTKQLTEWKNTWLEKDAEGKWIAAGSYQNMRLLAGADIYEKYLAELQKSNLFDYDDMILRALRGLEKYPELRYSLQERYLYIMLDEFQDTNESQFKLVQMLTDNPVNEGRPNILAVGDDDQAIFAFQGANYSHMLQYYERYKDTTVVTLTKNYRSHSDVLHAAGGISEQIETRLHHHFPGVSKKLTAANEKLPKQAIVQRHEFRSSLSQNAWVAQQIKRLIDEGLPAHEIAVLAPKHEHLGTLTPYLQFEKIPVHYEKRENILEDAAIEELVSMSRLIIALANNDTGLIDHYWPKVLSFAFWKLPTSLLWRLSWQAKDERLSWTEVLSDTAETRAIALFFIRLSQLAASESLEQLLDHLIGVTTVELQEKDLKAFRSPYYEHYFEPTLNGGGDTQEFWQLLSNLTVLRERLRDYRAGEQVQLSLVDFLDFIEAHLTAELKIINTNPYQEASDAVELLTAFKAKGQEYTAVFLLASIDEVWGTKARALGSRLSLAPNLQFIRYAGTTEDERLRLLYVAMTRAKTHLYMTSYESTFSGKATTRLKYLDERNDDDDSVISPLLPAGSQTVMIDDASQPAIEALSVNWRARHYVAVQQPELRSLLQAKLDNYQLSPTQFNNFLNAAHDGPSSFLLQTLLGFPGAPGAALDYGNAMHETLEWLHHTAKTNGRLPDLKTVKAAFSTRLQAKRLGEQLQSLLLARGYKAITIYLAQRSHTINATNEVEYNFRHENVFIGDAHLSGKIDKLIIDKNAKTVTVVDYKTGKSHTRWEREPRLHFYRNQLYLYKFMVEQSTRFKGYKVTDAYLEFVEPDEHGNINELHLKFDTGLEAEIKSLIQAVWHHIKGFDFPDVSSYGDDLKAIEAFEADLLKNHPLG